MFYSLQNLSKAQSMPIEDLITFEQGPPQKNDVLDLMFDPNIPPYTKSNPAKSDSDDKIFLHAKNPQNKFFTV